MTVNVTEIVALDATRVDAVQHPANGFPILLMKGIEPPAAIVEALKETTREEQVSTTETETTGTEAAKAEGAKEQPEFVEKSAVEELIKAAVTEAVKASEERMKAFEAELAKVMATAVPTTVAYTATTAATTDLRKSQLADAARFERLAETVNDPELRSYYMSKAASLNAATGV